MTKERKVWIINGSGPDCIIEEGVLLRKESSMCRIRIDDPEVERYCVRNKADDHIYYISTSDCAFSEEEVKNVITEKTKMDLWFWEYQFEEAEEEIKRTKKELKKVESTRYNPLKK